MKRRLQLNIALAFFERLNTPRLVRAFHPETGKSMGYKKILEDEKELEQFLIDFKRFPVTQTHLDEAFRQLKEMVKHHLTKEGLLK